MEQDKVSFLLLIFIAFLLMSSMISNSHYSDKAMDRLESLEQQMHERLEKRDQLDSLYREHLEKCSFISKDEVAVDKSGYFYSRYKKNERDIISVP
mgnify:CR=1 FL=1